MAYGGVQFAAQIKTLSLSGKFSTQLTQHPLFYFGTLRQTHKPLRGLLNSSLPPLSPRHLLLWVFSQERDVVWLKTSSLSPEWDLKYSSILHATPPEVTDECTEQHKSERDGRVTLHSGLPQRLETSGKLLYHLLTDSNGTSPFPGQFNLYPSDLTWPHENLDRGRRRREENKNSGEDGENSLNTGISLLPNADKF